MLNTFKHDLIEFTDMVCVAQMIEDVAFMVGIETCFIANINGYNDVFKPILNLPYNSYPILILSMGYPDSKSSEHMRKKYGEISVIIPKDEKYTVQWLSNIRKVLSTTYTKNRTEEIIADIIASVKINEMQRRFRFKYVSNKSIDESKKMKDDMNQCSLKMQIQKNIGNL